MRPYEMAKCHMLGTLAVGLAFLRTVDTVEADAFSFVGVQDSLLLTSVGPVLFSHEWQRSSFTSISFYCSFMVHCEFPSTGNALPLHRRLGG